MEIKQQKQIHGKVGKTYTTHIESLNLEACLYSTLLELLSTKCSFVISKQHRVSKKTIPFLKIRELTIDDDTIDIKNIMKKRGQSFITSLQQTSSIKTAQRRERSRRRMEMLFLLEDYLFLEGIDIHVNAASMYGVYGPITVQSDDTILLNTKHINIIGKNIVEYITNKISSGNDVLIEKNELTRFISPFVIL